MDLNRPYWVKHIGDRRAVLGGAIAGAIELRSLANIAGLYAVGPVAGVLGEVTVYNGAPAIATAAAGRPKVEARWDVGACFLAYGAAKAWRAQVLERPLAGLAAIDALVASAAEAAGLSPEAPLLFRLEGRAEALDYHVLFKADDAPHNPAEHERAKRRFHRAGAVKVIGFRADAAGVGVYTPDWRRVHLHFVSEDGEESGHVEDLKLAAGAVLFLPDSSTACCARAGSSSMVSDRVAGDHRSLASLSDKVARDHLCPASLSDAMTGDHLCPASLSDKVARDHLCPASSSDKAARDHRTPSSSSNTFACMKSCFCSA